MGFNKITLMVTSMSQEKEKVKDFDVSQMAPDNRCFFLGENRPFCYETFSMLAKTLNNTAFC